MSRIQRSGTALLVFALGFGAAVLCIKDLEASTGDWLSFAGALIGAALTVAGALLVVEYQQNLARRDRSRLFTDQLDEIAALCQNIREPNSAGELRQQTADRTVSISQLEAAVLRIKNTRSWVTPDSAAMIRAFDAIDGLFTQGDDLRRNLNLMSYYPSQVEQAREEVEAALAGLEIQAAAVRKHLA